MRTRARRGPSETGKVPSATLNFVKQGLFDRRKTVPLTRRRHARTNDLLILRDSQQHVCSSQEASSLRAGRLQSISWSEGVRRRVARRVRRPANSHLRHAWVLEPLEDPWATTQEPVAGGPVRDRVLSPGRVSTRGAPPPCLWVSSFGCLRPNEALGAAACLALSDFFFWGPLMSLQAGERLRTPHQFRPRGQARGQLLGMRSWSLVAHGFTW